MARRLNVSCDFSTGYLVCDIHRDTIEVKIKIKTRWGKHMLMEDKERKTQKLRPWEKCIPKMKISTKEGGIPNSNENPWFWVLRNMDISGRKVLGLYPNTWQTLPPTTSDKENELPNDTQTVMTINNLNLLDRVRNQGDVALPEWPQNFVGLYCPTCVLKWHRCLCIEESDWDDMVVLCNSVLTFNQIWCFDAYFFTCVVV